MLLPFLQSTKATTRAWLIALGLILYCVHYFWMDQVARVVDEAGLKANLAWCQFGIGTEHEVGGITLDEERILYEAERRAFRLVGAPMQQVRAYRG
jgi:hypothetical protein